MIPIAGSAYTYTYATLGELVAWIIGWDLILEYAFSNMSVSVGFAAHIVALFDWLGLPPRPSGSRLPICRKACRTSQGKDIYPIGWHAGFDIPAFLIVLLLTVVLVRGIRESARTNNIMVLVKIAAILLFIFFGLSFIHPANYHPFSPNGWSGILAGGSIIFFTYIGFDSVSTASEECGNPVATCPSASSPRSSSAPFSTSASPWCSPAWFPGNRSPDDGAPVVNALKRVWPRPGRPHGSTGCGSPSCVGALVGMVSSILVFQFGQARVWFAMSRDRLLPDIFSRIHPRFRTPAFATWVAGILVAIPAGLFDVGTFADDVEHRHTLRLRARLRSASSSCATKSPSAIAASACPSARSSRFSPSSSASC